MTEQYRKLTTDEVKALYNVMAGHFNKPSELQNQITKHVRKYYPNSACSAVLTVDSEYNDQTYDNSVSYLAVYDKDQNEILPIASTAKDCRNDWKNFRMADSDHGEGSLEPMGDIVVHLSTQVVPDLYIKKN